ncbi:fibronectin type III domain-containing protein [Gordonibacter urolithinfaciens]|uniref:fibronectin type III domain-containing protein n=1 Tax=Gordonibacter urolithinfaciens TaxID=1335613 RepID=UPI001F4E47DE|nr:fibronectin type III domain-containing protein [Gordonibacter urolithinfaciens]
MNGTIVIKFNGQIAVKKVTLTITKTSGSSNLAEISKVEFLNNMEERIPEPDLSAPTNLQAEPGSKKFTVSWSAATNVVGYELSLTAPGKDGADVTEVKRTTSTSLTITSFNGGKVKNGIEFHVKARSTNGEWRSPWTDEITVTPITSSKPDAPEGLKLTGMYRGLSASWKNMEDTDSYNLFYREKTDGNGPYTKIGNITSSSYQVTGLKDDVEYQVYVTGVNEIGESGPSLAAVARTANVNPAQLPAYRLVNTKDADGLYLDHIVSATYGRGSMVESPLDATSGVAKSALGLFDDNYASYLQVNDWDEGGYYPGSNKGVIVTFDEPQTLGMISFARCRMACRSVRWW